MPNLVAYDLAGVQPMNGPTGLIFAMRSKLETMGGEETFYNEVDSAFSTQNAGKTNSSNANNPQGDVGFGTTAQSGSNPGLLNPIGSATATTYNVGQGMSTKEAESLRGESTNAFRQMAFSIEKVTVTAKSRALKAEYSLELAQDLKAIHGLNAEAELANILSTEILAEINREVIRTIYISAETGAAVNTATAGTFDLDVDSNGRWSVEKFKGLIFQIERDANAIAQRTRRGKGNMILCSADVASALTMAGVLDYTPALNANLNVDDTGNTLLVFLQVSSESILTHTQQTYLLISTMLQVIKVHHLMTQVYSTAHTFLYRWYVVWEQIVSNQRLDSRLVTESSQTHLLKVQLYLQLMHLLVTATYTTEELKLQT